MNQDKKEQPILVLELGPIPMIVQSNEAFQTEGDQNGNDKKKEKKPRKLYQVTLNAVLDSFQLSLLYAKVEDHTAFFKVLDPSEAKREIEGEAEKETIEVETPGAVQ